jgi:hypothetical protein
MNFGSAGDSAAEPVSLSWYDIWGEAEGDELPCGALLAPDVRRGSASTHDDKDKQAE